MAGGNRSVRKGIDGVKAGAREMRLDKKRQVGTSDDTDVVATLRKHHGGLEGRPAEKVAADENAFAAGKLIERRR